MKTCLSAHRGAGLKLGYDLVKEGANHDKNRSVAELDEAPIKQPMRPDKKISRKPSTDQKKVRRRLQNQKTAGHLDPIAYTYEADYHCPGCAVKRFGNEPGHPWPPEDATDSEGNRVGAVAPWDEWANLDEGCEALGCGTCGGIIDNAHVAECEENFGDQPCTLSASQKKAHKESDLMTFEEREAQILQAMSKANLDEQKKLAKDLADLRQQRTASVQTDRDIELSDAIIRDHLTPVMTHGLNTTATDWLDDVPDMPNEEMETQVVTEASLWFERLHSAVREDQEEFMIQAEGKARHISGRYGDKAEEAQKRFMDHVSFLQRRTGGNPQSGYGESTITDYKTKAEQPPFLSEDWEDTDADEVPSTRSEVIQENSGGSSDEEKKEGSKQEPEGSGIPFDPSTTGSISGQSSSHEASLQATARSLNQIAYEIANDWGAKVNFAARPYLEAMMSLDSISDMYGADSARTVVSYFLSNAAQYRGEKAKALKKELKDMLAGKTSQKTAGGTMGHSPGDAAQTWIQGYASLGHSFTGATGPDTDPRGWHEIREGVRVVNCSKCSASLTITQQPGHGWWAEGPNYECPGKTSSKTAAEPDHELKIAIDTLKMPDAMAGVMGGPSKEEARKIIRDRGLDPAQYEKTGAEDFFNEHVRIIPVSIPPSTKKTSALMAEAVAGGYILRTKGGAIYELDSEGAVISRSDGPAGFNYSGQWKIIGFKKRFNSNDTVLLAEAADGADVGQGWVVDSDHGTIRIWGNPSHRRLDSINRVGTKVMSEITAALTRKDFQAIADLLVRTKASNDQINAFADWCATQNPQFDRARFLSAAGGTDTSKQSGKEAADKALAFRTRVQENLGSES